MKKELTQMIRFDEPGREDFEHLGDLLLYLRKTYGERTGQDPADSLRVTVHASAVIECLNRSKYSMTSGSFSLLEQGKTLPKDPERFLDVIGRCMKIDRSSKYWYLLRYQYVYDVARRTLGPEFADKYVARGSQALRLLRSGQLPIAAEV